MGLGQFSGREGWCRLQQESDVVAVLPAVARADALLQQRPHLLREDVVQRVRADGRAAIEFENLRAVQLFLGHSKPESTVMYLGIEVDNALEISEQTEI